jgi:hypothetical protein
MGDAEAFVVTDHIDGPDLGTWVARNGCPEPRRAVRWVRSLAEAVAFAHRRGVVHGDLKPENVILGPSLSPMLTDFGAAALAWAVSPAQPVGSIAFAAPEQVTGARADARTDVYSLGALLYFLLTGRAPHSLAASFFAVREVASGLSKPLSLMRPGLPPALYALCERAMATKPDERFDGVEALAQALAPFCEAQSPDLDDFLVSEHTPTPTPLPVTLVTIKAGAAKANGSKAGAGRPVPSFNPASETMEVEPDKTAFPRRVGVVAMRDQAAQNRSLRRLLLTACAIALVSTGVAGVFVMKASLRDGWLKTALAPQPPAVVPDPAPSRAPGPVPTIEAPEGNPAVAPASDGSLVLTTEPSADVYIDQKYWGRTPGLRQLWLPPGPHVLKVLNPSFRQYTETIDVRPGTSITRHVALEAK